MDDVTHLSTNESLSKNITNLDLRVVQDERNVEYNVSDNRLDSSLLLPYLLLSVDVPFILRSKDLGGR